MTGISDKEERYDRKVRRIARNAAWAAGLGVGILIVRLIAPVFGEISEGTNAAFSAAGVAMILYGGTQLLGVVFMRKHAVKISLLLTYVILPSVLIKIWLDL